MKASNKAIRNAWGWLMILGIASLIAGIYVVVTDPTSPKSWIHFVLGAATALLFYKNFIKYHNLVKQGIKYDS